MARIHDHTRGSTTRTPPLTQRYSLNVGPCPKIRTAKNNVRILKIITHIAIGLQSSITYLRCVYTSSFYRKVTDIQAYRHTDTLFQIFRNAIYTAHRFTDIIRKIGVAEGGTCMGLCLNFSVFFLIFQYSISIIQYRMIFYSQNEPLDVFCFEFQSKKFSNST